MRNVNPATLVLNYTNPRQDLESLGIPKKTVKKMLHGPHFHTDRVMYDSRNVWYNSVTLCTKTDCRKRRVVPGYIVARTAWDILHGKYEPNDQYAQTAFMYCHGGTKCLRCKSVTVEEMAAQDFDIE